MLAVERPLRATVPPQFTDTIIATLPSPTALAFTPDGRLLITSQTGKLHVLQDDNLISSAALDLTSRLCSNLERGLLGIAVDPAFATNGFIYLFYTFNKFGSCLTQVANVPVHRVSRFTLGSNNVVDPASELILIDNIPSMGAYHNAGDLGFGTDGYLYVSVGDGGCDYAGNSGCSAANDANRDPHVLLGKILRITSAGGIPPDNPFQGTDSARCAAGPTTPGKKCQEMFAWGLRNPFRIAFDPASASTRFFIIDVGETLWEEINLGKAGADYGWNMREGLCAPDQPNCGGPPPASLTNPIYAYGHEGGCGAITGGAFVPSGVWPAQYNGAFFFTDYVCGMMFSIIPAGNGTYTRTTFATNLNSPVAMKFGPFGTSQALYYTTFSDGRVRRISLIGPTNSVPIASATANPTSGATPLAVHFDGSASSDPDGDPITYDWNFGDGSQNAATAIADHTYTAAGPRTATLTVRDSKGASATTTISIQAGNTPPVPAILSPTASTRFRVGENITLRGSATDAQDVTVPDNRLSWTVLRRHDTHWHPYMQPTVGNNIVVPMPGPENFLAAGNSHLEVLLTATDLQGATTTIVQDLLPNKVNVTFATQPAGRRVDASGTSLTGPQTVTSWEGYVLNVSAPSQTDGSGQQWNFASWSDGGGGAHAITTPAGAVSYTATFTDTAQTLPPGFQLEEIIGSGLSAPTALEFLPDGSMLIAEFGGTIKFVPPGGIEVNATPVLTLPNMFHESVSLGGERGLVGILADPNFGTNHYFYVFYTANNPRRDRVSRFELVGATAAPSSETVIWQAAADSISTDHHGGGLAFGLDGKLYIGTGDNGDPPSSQQLTSDHGKILRVNADGTIPTDNPFYDGNGPHIDAIWALGFRNPYRMSFDTATGRLYIGDVGQTMTEEVNLGVAGSNYGWPTCEGSCGAVGMRNPIHGFSHDGRDSAVTGGFVYSGTQFPSQYRGVYFFGNYVQSWLRYLTLDANGNATGVVNFQPTSGAPGGPFGFIVSIKQGPDGALYYVDIGGDGTAAFTGTIGIPKVRRIRYLSQNQPPVVVSSASPVIGLAPLQVNFSSMGANDPEGQPLSFLWTFGDGTTSTAANPSHVYNQNAEYAARLSVSDGTHTTLGATILIRVGSPPVPVIGSPISSTFRGNDVIQLSGSATDPDDGILGPSALSWTILFHHDTHIHPGGSFSGVASGSFTIPSSGHDFSGNTFYEIVLTARDSSGLTASTSKIISPQKVNLSFTSVPSGMQLTLDGVPFVTPFVRDELVNFRYTIDAPSQVLGGTPYNFSSWSDGGAQAHEYTTPVSAQSLSATFNVNPAAPGLIAAYSFNEGSGLQVGDASGAGHVGTVAGATWSTQGKFGGALSFDGVNDWVTVASTPLLNLTTGMTLEAWVFPTASTGTRDILIKEGSNVDIYNLYARNWQGMPEANVLVGGANRTAQGTALPTNVWTHLTGTFDGITVRLYVNGVQVATSAVSGAVSTSTGALRIGGNSLWGEFFQGRLDEIRVYNRALTQSQIQADMNLPVGPAAPDTTPPLRSNGLPTGTIAAGPPPAVLRLTTDENAACRYSLTSGVAFDAMAGTFATTGATAHSTPADGSTSVGTFAYYVRCRDAAGNANPDDFTITFTTRYVTTFTVFPTGAAVLTGTLSSGAAANLAADDNVYYSVSSTTTGTRTAAWYGAFTGIPKNLTNLLASYKGNNSRSCTQTVAIWRWPTSTWVQLDSRSVGTTEIAINNLAAPGALADYVSGTGASGEVRIRIQCQAAANLTSRGDVMSVTFEVPSGPTPPDTTPPALSNGQPSGTLPAGTTQTSLTLATDENATCRYGTSAGIAFDSMTSTFTSTGTTAHSTNVGGLTNGAAYSFLVRCQDVASNASTTDFIISFSVALSPSDMTPPVRSIGQPSGTLPASTTQATLSLTTDESATCRYSTSAGMPYATMSTTFATTGSTAHSTPVTGLAPGTASSFFVRCQDALGNANTNDFAIAFSVAPGSAPAGLVAAYSFNQGAGTTAPDASGNSLVGTISGATWSTQGKFGGALSFDGQNDWLTVAATPILNLTTGMTLEAWVLPTTTSGVRDVVIKEGSNVDIYNLYARNWRGRPEANILVGGANRTAEGAALAANVWTHLAATYDGTTARLFVNGTQIASTAVSGSIPTSTGVLRIGGNSLWGEFFQGRIDEVRIYNRALTQAEIQGDMATPIVP